jgi:aminoglycoside/choline kinase family phosphotransferase
MAEILNTLSAITPGWLEEALAEAGHAPPPVASVEVRLMDGFTGVMGEVGIVSAVYADDTDLPADFVAKCPLDDDLARLYNSVRLSYLREASFYADMAGPLSAVSGMRVPRCYVNLFDPDTHSATLLLERIHPATKGDNLEGTTFERMRTLVGDLARMHGAYWMDEKLLEHEWILDWHAPTFLLAIPFVRQAWSDMREQFPERHPDDIAALADEFTADIEGWLDRFNQRPWTLIHQDYQLDNVLFRADGPVIVDWQSAMRCFPSDDLGWLLMTGHNDETLAREPELLAHYRRELAGAGGPDWSEEDLAEDLAWSGFYRASTGHVPWLHTLSAGERGRPLRRFEAIMEGSIAAAQRWQTVERMRAHT